MYWRICSMKLKYAFALTAPLVFLFVAACDFSGVVSLEINCPLPLPVVTDTLLTGTFNGACPYYIFDGDSLILVTPGVVN